MVNFFDQVDSRQLDADIAAAVAANTVKAKPPITQTTHTVSPPAVKAGPAKPLVSRELRRKLLTSGVLFALGFITALILSAWWSNRGNPTTAPHLSQMMEPGQYYVLRYPSSVGY